MALGRARKRLRKLVGLDKPNRVARLTGALQEICRLDPREGYTLSDAARIAEDGLANPPDYIWPVRPEPDRDEVKEQAISDLPGEDREPARDHAR